MIGGNTSIQFQVRDGFTRNEIGQRVSDWKTVQTIHGWLDLSDGDSKHITYSAKIQESTHVFVSDYVAIESGIDAENSRVIDEDGLIYDVMLIDDPMKMHKQLEIYLKFTGGQ